MKRLPIRGASQCASPVLTPYDLKRALVRLEVAHAFNDGTVERVYWRLGEISGDWLAIQESKEASSVVATLRKLHRDLAYAAEVFDGTSTGFTTTTQKFATRLVTETLSINPEVRDAANFVVEFQQNAGVLAHACQVIPIR